MFSILRPHLYSKLCLNNAFDISNILIQCKMHRKFSIRCSPSMQLMFQFHQNQCASTNTFNKSSYGATLPTVHSSVNYYHYLCTKINVKSSPLLNIHCRCESERTQNSTETRTSKIWKYIVTPSENMQLFPTFLQPYLRLMRYDKPIGTFLVMYPALWSLILATPNGCFPDYFLLPLFTVNAFFMRSAGCIINDLWDKDFDKNVQRTKLRPLACDEITNYQALSCLAICLSIPFISLLQLNNYSIAVGICGLIPISLYPLLKRFTHYPQVGLGLTINWGVLLASSAVNGYCDWNIVLPLYFGSFFWTMYYDTIYAHQDKNDDIRIGIKSTAIKFGKHTKLFLSGFAGLAIYMWSVAGIAADASWIYFLTLSIYGFHFMEVINNLNINNPTNCLEAFKKEKKFGFMLFIGCLLSVRLGEFLLVEEGDDWLFDNAAAAVKFVHRKLDIRKKQTQTGLNKEHTVGLSENNSHDICVSESFSNHLEQKLQPDFTRTFFEDDIGLHSTLDSNESRDQAETNDEIESRNDIQSIYNSYGSDDKAEENEEKQSVNNKSNMTVIPPPQTPLSITFLPSSKKYNPQNMLDRSEKL